MTVNIAILWDRQIEYGSQNPLSDEELTRTYEIFSEIASSKGGEVHLAYFEDMGRDGLKCSTSYESGEWRKREDIKVDAVYDKYKFEKDTKDLKKRINSDYHVINKYELERICKDKLLTYHNFDTPVPETRVATKTNIEKMLSNGGKVVLKPRYDLGGKGVRLLKSTEEFERESNQIVQRYIDASGGLEDMEVEGVHDLRVLVVNGSPEAAYFRLADEGFISNVSKGGTIKHVELDKLPEVVFEVVEEISDTLDKWNPSYYSVDMVFDREKKPQVLELNSKPALNFHGDESIKSWKKPVMEKLVDNLLEID